MKTAKAVVAGIGATITALATANAAVQLALEDGALSFDEYGSVAGALILLGTTVYAVWRTPNAPAE